LTRPRRIQLTFSLPPASQASSTLPLVKAAFEIVDALSNIFGSHSGLLPTGHPARSAVLQPETIRKLRSTRREWDERLEKERTANKAAEEDSARRAAKKKAEDEKLSKLSPAEQQKVNESSKPVSFRVIMMCAFCYIFPFSPLLLPFASSL
jgi:hypothetical protein